MIPKLPLKRFGQAALLLLLLLMLQHCKEGDSVEPKSEGTSAAAFPHVPWSWKANIYEVNLRQYTPEGTIKAFTPYLSQLKTMGVDVLWLMPIYPIGEKNRKGSLGSYYAVKDYKAVNPELGTLEDLRDLVKKAHGMGMYVILDWVANHTAWDNALIKEHPDWYTLDSAGKMMPPNPDWKDVADLNFENNGLREYMTNAMDFWVENADVDGFRCDVAEMVPMDFWDAAVEKLNQRKKLFMLAEAEGPQFHRKAFDMTYGWEMHALMNEIAKGKKGVGDFGSLLERQRNAYPDDAFRMNFTSNHDENSWNGSEWERMGQGAWPLAVLACTMDGMPLVYSGQEAGLEKRLDFFEKDTIIWKDHPMRGLYTKLLNLRHTHEALWLPPQGGMMEPMSLNGSDKVLAYTRVKGADTVAVFLNLGADSAKVTLMDNLPSGEFKEVFSNKLQKLGGGTEFVFPGWAYRVYVLNGE